MVLDFVAEELAELERSGLLRSTRTVDGPQGDRLRLDGRDVVNFSANDYLGLAADPRLAAAAARTLEQVGTGAGASRLIAGTHREHELLEAELARFHEGEAALLFGSGFLANLGVIPVLVGRGDAVFSDALNHASLIDACRLSRAQVLVYPHTDLGALSRLLKERGGPFRRRLLVSETVFSMDGDRAPVAELAELAYQHRAMLLLDEAHALGVLGPSGRGLAATSGVVPDVLIATLGKALGVYGAYAICSKPLRELLLNRARSFVFTTAPPPALAAAVREALRIVAGQEGEERRRALHDRIAHLAEGLAGLDLLAPGAGTTPIFPVRIGDASRAMRLSQHLLERGLFAQGIRPPTVPPGTARLRISLTATHDLGPIDRLLLALAEHRST